MLDERWVNDSIGGINWIVTLRHFSDLLFHKLVLSNMVTYPV